MISRLERSPGGGHGNSFQYSCLDNPLNRGAWQAIVHRVAKNWTWLNRLNMCAHGIYNSNKCKIFLWQFRDPLQINSWILWSKWLLYCLFIIIWLNKSFPVWIVKLSIHICSHIQKIFRIHVYPCEIKILFPPDILYLY